MNFVKGFDAYKNDNKFEDLILEALKVSEVRPYIQAWEESGGRERYAEWFDNKWRVYIPLESEKSDIQYEVEDILKENGYYVVDYHANKAKKIGDEKTNFENLPKIGRLLNRFAPELASSYANDKDTVKNDGSLQVVISRHPYDIAGMTTDRRWNSCMDIRGGMNKSYVMKDVIKGTLVAYVIKKEDTNINDPINRLLMKPFINDDGKTMLGTDDVYFGDDDDREVVGFRVTVDNWLEEKQGAIDDRYDLDYSLYDDGNDTIDQNSKLYRKLMMRYKDITVMCENTLRVTDKNGKHGLVDMEGNVLIKPSYSFLLYIGSDSLLVGVGSKGDMKYSIIDKTNKPISDKVYTEYNLYGYYIVFKGDGFYTVYYTKDEDILVKDYQDAKLVGNYYLCLKEIGSKLYSINGVYGSLISTSIFEDILDGRGSDLIVVVKGKYGVYDCDNLKYTIPAEYNKIRYNDYMYFVEKDGKCGLFNTDGNQIIPVEYDSIKPNDSYRERFNVSKDSKYGIVNKYGSVLLPCILPFEVDNMSSFNDDIRFVNKDVLWGAVNIKTGKVILPIEYRAMTYTSNNNFFKATKEVNGKNVCGVINANTGKFVIPCEYHSISSDDNCFIVEKIINSKNYYGLYDVNGNKLYDTIFTYNGYDYDSEEGERYVLSNGKKTVYISHYGIMEEKGNKKGAK